MKKILLTLLALTLLVSLTFAQWHFHDRKLAKMEARNEGEIQSLIENDYIISNIEVKNVFLYLNETELAGLKGQGYIVYYIPDLSWIYADSLWRATKDSDDPMDDYHTYEQLTAELQALAVAYPSICELQSAGSSVQGRQLWVMKMSDNVEVEEDEPEFFWISSMHGDEVVGMELCMYLINYFIDNYPANPQVAFLLNNTCIFIMPSMNPDGTAAFSRMNAQGFDLNREFPDRIDDPFNITTGRPTEVQVMMNFQQTISPVLSANYHGGTLVMNYPYDSNPNHQNVNTPTPDDSWFIDLSLTYSMLNLPMYNGPFPQGITNGADWYTIYGGMQDWNYVWKGCADVTIEVSVQGWPPANTLPTYWDNNQEAMLAYMMMVHQGVRGLVTDSITGEPIPAIITVDNNPHEVYPDPNIGDYYRLLLPGTYNMHYYCYGYNPLTVSNVTVTEGNLTRVDVEMTLAQPGYSFDNLEGAVGGYTHSAITAGFGDQWHLSTQRSVSPTHSWKCGNTGTGNYSNSLDAGLVTPTLNIQPNSVLSFWQYLDAEVSSAFYPYAYDGGKVEVKMVGDSVWTPLTPVGGYPYLIRNTGGTGPFPPETPVFSGQIDGREAFFNLAGYSGPGQFRFRFGSDGATNREGWYIDDIELTAEGGTVVTIDLNPVNPPIVILPTGGNFNYTVTLQNTSNLAQNFDAWIMAQLPTGNLVGPILLRNLTLGPNGSLVRTITQFVPATAPAGQYLFIGRIGDYPNIIWMEDSFSFTKQ